MTAPAPRPPFVLRKSSRYALLVAPFVIIAGFWAIPGLLYYDAVKSRPAEPTLAAKPDGHKLFVSHCARCHGENGDGKGVANLNPAARAFGYEPFKFGTTTNAIPTDDDLRRLIRRGIPGSSMPAFSPEELPDDQLDAVLTRVRAMTVRGLYRVKEETDGADMDPPEIHQYAVTAARVGKPLARPTVPPATSDTVRRGKEVFLSAKAGCVSCHGTDGKGLLQKAKDGTPVVVRDLTSGVYKGGGEAADLFVRLRLGIPGKVAMPPLGKDGKIVEPPMKPDIPDEDVFALVHYVQSLRAK